MTLRIEREYIDVTVMDPRDPDPRWSFIDRAGHKHRWSGSELPTLQPKLNYRWFCQDCRDEHEDWSLACKECGEDVEPGTIAGNPVQRIPGPVSYYLDDQLITKEEAEAFIETAKKGGTDADHGA